MGLEVESSTELLSHIFPKPWPVFFLNPYSALLFVSQLTQLIVHLLYVKESDLRPVTNVAMDENSIALSAAESRVLIVMTGYVLFGRLPSFPDPFGNMKWERGL